MDSVRAQISAGLACLARGDWAGAVRELTGAARREAGSLRVVRGLATAHLQLGNADVARAVIGRFVLAQPLSAEGWRLAALLEWKLGRRDEAIRVIARGLERLPGSDVLNQQMDVFTGAMGDRVSVVTAAAEGLGRGGRVGGTVDADWLDRVARDAALLEGVLRVADGRKDLGVLRALAERVAELLDAQPGHADRQLALARLQWKVGDVAGARVAVERALKANPLYAEARRMKEELGRAESSTSVRLAA
jgi:tetratricopeptide (TPR) repeat protein